MEKDKTSKMDNFQKNKRRAIKAFLDPRNKTVADVAESIGVKPDRILNYLGDENFVQVIRDAKESLKHDVPA